MFEYMSVMDEHYHNAIQVILVITQLSYLNPLDKIITIISSP